jgi:hypothetical protein
MSADCIQNFHRDYELGCPINAVPLKGSALRLVWNERPHCCVGSNGLLYSVYHLVSAQNPNIRSCHHLYVG